jgi:hypothetical protein
MRSYPAHRQRSDFLQRDLVIALFGKRPGNGKANNPVFTGGPATYQFYRQRRLTANCTLGHRTPLI